MVVDLERFMRQRMAPQIWDFLCRHNARVIAWRNDGVQVDPAELDKIARMIGHYRRQWAANQKGV